MRARRTSFVTAPGIAQATYDAAVAKLVTVSSWLDLTATITTACAGAAASDPDSLAAGLTVTTSTGTFDGATIPCNEFAWTTHTTTNDGYNETLNYDLGTIASLIADYDPAIHHLQFEADLVATGTLNSATPIVGVAVAAAGTLTDPAPGVAWQITTATSVLPLFGFNPTSRRVAGAAKDPTAVAGRCGSRLMRGPPSPTTKAAVLAANVVMDANAPAYFSGATYSVLDKLILIIGQGSTTQGAISGFKIRLRVRTIVAANLQLFDTAAVDLGCQA